MKAINIKIAVVTVIFSLVSIISLNAQNGKEFFFDRKYENNQLSSKTKYEMKDSGLFEKTYMYQYKYNEWGKLSFEETYKWEEKKSQWIPDYCIEHKYNPIDNSMVLEYFKWNKKENKYNAISEKAIYRMDEYGKIISCTMIKNPDKMVEEASIAFIPNLY